MHRKDILYRMNNTLNINEQEVRLKRKLLLVILFIVYPAYILQACAVSPLYTITDSNILYNGFISLLFYFLGIIIDLFVIYISLSTVIYGMYKFPIREIRSTIAFVLMSISTQVEDASAILSPPRTISK